MVRGRAVFADITNVVNNVGDDANSGLTRTAPGGHDNRTRMDKAGLRHTVQSGSKPIELITGRLQAMAIESTSVTEHSEAYGHGLTRASSSGRTRRSSSQTGLRTTTIQPRRLSDSRAGNRRASPHAIAGSGAGCTPKTFEPEPRRVAPVPAEEPQAPKSSLTRTSPHSQPAPAEVVHPAALTVSPSGKGFLSEKLTESTHLAAYFENIRQLTPGNPDDQLDTVLGDVVDDFLRFSHEESQRHLPTPEQLMACLAGSQRESIIEWLVQACDIMRLQDGVLYSTVLMLDRYCVAAREPLPMEKMHKVLMAVICTVLKTCTVSDDITMPLRELLLHLCRRQVNIDEIYTMEHRVLQALQFSGLSAPSPLDFVDALCTPLLAIGETMESSKTRCLSNFLVQLSLFDAKMYYRHPHAVLAAAGIYVALCGLHSPNVMAALQSLLHDVSAVCRDMPDARTRVTTCASQLHHIWLEFAASQGSKVPCLLHKFSGSRLHAAVILGPPAALISVSSPSPLRSK